MERVDGVVGESQLEIAVAQIERSQGLDCFVDLQSEHQSLTSVSADKFQSPDFFFAHCELFDQVGSYLVTAAW